MKKNHYQILGVHQNASQNAIESAYAELRIKYQVLYDQGDQESSIALFNIKGAYDTLSNPDKRTAYDDKLAEMQFQPKTAPIKIEDKSQAAPSVSKQNNHTKKSEANLPNPKLAKCKTCGQEVSKTATTCPHCGEKNPVNTQVSGCLGIIVAFFVISFFIGIFSGSNTGGNSTPKYDEFLAQADCESFVKKNLKAPSSADFAPHRELHITGSGTGPWTVVGYVDAQNSFGAKIRSTFTCTVHYQGDMAYLDSVQIN